MGVFLLCLVACGNGNSQPIVNPPAPPIVNPPVPPIELVSGCSDMAPVVQLTGATVAQCTATDLRSKLEAGGVVRLSACTSPIVLSTPIAISADTVFDADGATLQGAGANVIITVGKGRNFTIQNATLRDGKSSNGVPGQDGGAIQGAQFSNLTVINSRFVGNTSGGLGGEDGGGAIYKAEGGKLTVFNSTFENNTATNGGAIKALLTSVQIINSSFIGNTARGGNNGGGAVIIDGLEQTPPPSYAPVGYVVHPYAKGRVCGSLFRGNTVGNQYDFNSTGKQGGGFFTHTYPSQSPSLIEVERSLFENNTAANDGGAMRFGDGTIQIKSVVARGNQASNGGGIRFSNSATASIENSSLESNCATSTGVACSQGYSSTNNIPSIIGGGATAFDGTVNIKQSTIVRNSSQVYSGGLGGDGFKTGKLENSILGNNLARGPYNNTHNCGAPMLLGSSSFEFPAAGGGQFDLGCGAASTNNPQVSTTSTDCPTVAGSSFIRTPMLVWRPNSAASSAGAVCPTP